MIPLRTLGLALLALTAASSWTRAQQPARVSFVPHWLPQAQFAGYYVAQDLGFYKKHGLELKILTGGPNVSSQYLLEQGKVDFASVWLSNAIRLKSEGTDVVNIAQLVPRSALMLVSKKSSGIKTPQDMNGKKVGLWGGDFLLRPLLFFKKFNLNVRTILQGSSINLFFYDGVDVTSAMWYNEYHTILISGFRPDELNTFFLSDYGLNFPEEGIYCSARLLKTAPETCRRFVLATFEGWKHAFEHQDEAMVILTRYMSRAGLPVNKAHQRWMLARMRDLIFSKGRIEDFQKLPESDYLFVATTLKESGAIQNTPPYKSLYQPVFVRDAQ